MAIATSATVESSNVSPENERFEEPRSKRRRMRRRQHGGIDQTLRTRGWTILKKTWKLPELKPNETNDRTLTVVKFRDPSHSKREPFFAMKEGTHEPRSMLGLEVLERTVYSAVRVGERSWAWEVLT